MEKTLTNENESPSSPVQPKPLLDATEPVVAPEERNAPPAGTALGEAVPEYAAYKCFFYTPKRGETAGAFCIIFEGSNGRELFQNFWVTRTENVPALAVNQDWRDFSRALNQMGPFDKVIGDKLFSSLSEFLSPAERMSLFENANNRKGQNLIMEGLRRHFERTTHYFLEISCDLQLLTHQDLVDAKILTDPDEEDARQGSARDEDKDFSDTLIHCLPLIDPVYGKALSDLEPGDLLEVRIKSDVGAGGLLQHFLSVANLPSIFPVKSIEKRDDDSDKVYVYLAISDEIQGLLILTKDLKLKTIVPPKTAFKKFLKIENVVFAGTLVFAFVVILFVIRRLFF
ncbi:MAG: hypothetical protein GX256_08480 [Fretibacterium sp.]|nr:hypothetical protein [Fretibacterium sp.]